MPQPGVPGGPSERLDLPCGQTVSAHDLDLGVREFECACGDTHGVVMDSHPLTRFVPEFLADVLRETIETDDDFEEFTTTHLLAMISEEYPERVVSADLADDGHVGYALVWVADFDSRRLHEIAVQLLVELMDHAISHADDDAAVQEFEQYLNEFDVDAFVTEFRSQRDFESEHDTAI
jgi:hypothetical protein